MIGLGIFVLFCYVMENSGFVGLILIVWSLCGVLVMFGVLCYFEFGIMILLFGVEYVYLFEGFGLFVVFFYLWIFVIVLKFL